MSAPGYNAPMTTPMNRRQWCGGLLGAAASAWIAKPGRAQVAWKPERPIEIVVGTDPGSGFDRTARAVQKIIQDAKLIDVPVTVVNKPGANSTLGYVYLNEKPGDGHVIAVVSPLFLTNRLVGQSTIRHTDVTPLSILVTEEIAFAVKADSALTSGRDLIARLKADPASVTIGMPGVGGQNHIALALIAKAAGIDVRRLKLLGVTGSSDAIAAVLDGRAEAIVGPASSVLPQMRTGALRALALASEARGDGAWANVPSWKELGVDAAFSNWRGFVGPLALTAAQIAYWDGVFARVTATAEWKAEIERGQLVALTMNSGQAKAFLDFENVQLAAILKELGLAP